MCFQLTTFWITSFEVCWSGFSALKLSGVQYSAPALSCCYGKHLLGIFPFPQGTASMFWKDGMWTNLTRCGVLGLVPKHLIILCKAFAPSVLSRCFSEISIGLRTKKGYDFCLQMGKHRNTTKVGGRSAQGCLPHSIISWRWAIWHWPGSDGRCSITVGCVSQDTF